MVSTTILLTASVSSDTSVVAGVVVSLLVILVAATWFLRAWRRRVAANSGGAEGEAEFATFDERPIEDVERTFAEVVAKGMIRTEAATAEDRARARIPAHAGPVFRTLAGRYRAIELSEVGVKFVLHDGAVADDSLGGWRIRAEPDEVDVRLAPQSGLDIHTLHASADKSTGDVILDATWSPRTSIAVARHSTFLHFIVRAALGDRA
jgi:hypothetical protein